MTPEEIKQNRKRLGLTQLQVAIRVGVSFPTYRLWENGGTKPNPENAIKLKEILTAAE